MKNFGIVIAALAGLVVAACSNTQLDKFNSGVANFVSAIHTVDSALKDINATVYSNCNSLVSTAKAINDLSGQCSKAAPYTSVANEVIDNYCQSDAAQNAGIAKSISITASSVSAAKSKLASNKTACAAGS